MPEHIGCAAHGALNCAECSGSNALARAMGHDARGDRFLGQVPAREDMLIWCMTPADARELDDLFRRAFLVGSPVLHRLALYRKRLQAAMVAAGYELPE
jgi:hypothetical protein